MKYTEEPKDLFSVDFKKWTPAHCISLDCKMGAGIAVPVKKKFNLSGLYDVVDELGLEYPVCVHHNGVYNLITKKNYWDKPTYDTLEGALISMRDHALKNGINHIVMPKIGCGIDGLSWSIVREFIQEVFDDTDIEILICYI
jgi:hypothetical protein